MEPLPRGADPTSIRRWNEVAVVRALYAGGPQRIRALRDTTGITPGPLGQVLRSLEQKHWVESARAEITGPGRPAQIFRLVPPRGWLIGVDVTPTVLRAVRIDATGSVHARAEQENIADVEPEVSFAALVNLMDRVLPGDDYSSIWAAMIAIDAEFDDDAMVLDSAALPRLVGTRAGDRMNARIPVPLDATGRMPAMLTAEMFEGAAIDMSNFMEINMGERIEAGVVVDGRPIGGSHQVAGLFPQVTTSRVAAVTDAARNGDEAARRTICEDVSRYVDSIAMAIALADPRALILSGPLATVPDLVLPYLRDELGRRLRSVPEVRVTGLDDYGVATGAARCALEWVLSVLLGADTGAMDLTRSTFLARIREIGI